MPDPCCRHCGHAASYQHPPHSHCAVCFPNAEDQALFALMQTSAAVECRDLPAHA